MTAPGRREKYSQIMDKWLKSRIYEILQHNNKKDRQANQQTGKKL